MELFIGNDQALSLLTSQVKNELRDKLFPCSFGYIKAVSSVLFGRINGEKIIPYKKKHILYKYNGLIILNL